MNLKRGDKGFGFRFNSKRAQVTIFVIIAVILVAAVAIYFVIRSSVSAKAQVPEDFQPIYNNLLSCIEDNALTGINVLESQGGYIYLPDFEPGSSYQPFSSDLVFLGNPIPYWYYISGNNIPKEQVSNKSFMESQLAQFIDGKIRDCEFSNSSDFQIIEGLPDSSVTIKSDSVNVKIVMDLTLTKGDHTVTIKTHKVTVNSELGNLFDSAKKVYDYEKSSQFLENYTVDVMRSYAPVDGVDLSCAPKTWSASSIFSDLRNAITDNILSLRSGVNKTDYFNLKLDVNGVSFITNPDWTSSYQVDPTSGDVLLAEPIGNQEGLGILGFCYVPYHFVYSIKYPVLTLIRSGDEVFQFPMAVVIENNLPRSSASENGAALQSSSSSLCEQGTTSVSVNVFDSSSNPLDANLSYECFGQTCTVGQTSSGTLNGNFPQCVNGYIIASASGFSQQKYLFSTVQSGNVNLIMDKLYSEKINLKVGGNSYSDEAIISFTSSNGDSQTVVYPNQKTVNLSEGDYTISVYTYSSSSLKVGSSTSQQCVDIPSVFGATQQQCFNVNVPSQVVSNALSGGGSTEYFILEDDLSGSNTITLSVSSLPTPTSLQQLQTNYVLLGNNNLEVSFNG